MHIRITLTLRHAVALLWLVSALLSAGVASAAPSQPQPVNTSTIIVQLANGHVAAELNAATPLTDGGMGAGLVNFQTLLAQAKNCQAVDTTPPHVDHTLPANGASAVKLSSELMVVFSEAMAPASINTNSFYVTKAADGPNGPHISGSVVYESSVNDPPHSARWIVGGGNLAPSTVYIAHVTIAVTDVAGNHMTTDYTWTFGTETVSGGPRIYVFLPMAKR